jgi:hypothetical protein
MLKPWLLQPAWRSVRACPGKGGLSLSLPYDQARWGGMLGWYHVGWYLDCPLVCQAIWFGTHIRPLARGL